MLMRPADPSVSSSAFGARGALTSLATILFSVACLTTTSVVSGWSAEAIPRRTAGLIVSRGDGAIYMRRVDLPSAPMTALDMIERSGLAFTLGDAQAGGAVCSLDDHGCFFPRDNCQCRSDIWNLFLGAADGADYAAGPQSPADSVVASGQGNLWMWGDFTTAPLAGEMTLQRAYLYRTLRETMYLRDSRRNGRFNDAFANAGQGVARAAPSPPGERLDPKPGSQPYVFSLFDGVTFYSNPVDGGIADEGIEASFWTHKEGDGVSALWTTLWLVDKVGGDPIYVGQGAALIPETPEGGFVPVQVRVPNHRTIRVRDRRLRLDLRASLDKTDTVELAINGDGFASSYLSLPTSPSLTKDFSVPMALTEGPLSHQTSRDPSGAMAMDTSGVLHVTYVGGDPEANAPGSDR